MGTNVKCQQKTMGTDVYMKLHAYSYTLLQSIEDKNNHNS
jgi:hypothetical protein